MSGSLVVRAGLALCPSGVSLRAPWVWIRGGVIAGLGEGAPPGEAADAPVVEARECVLVPGLVNAHTHLALTATGGRLAPTPDFWGWIVALIDLWRATTEEERAQGLAEGLRLSLEAGTTALLDFFAVMPLPPTPVRVRQAEELFAFELGQTAPRMAQWVSRGSPYAAPHAVYSTTAELIEMVADQVRRQRGVLTIHLSETEEENQLWQIGRSDGADRYFAHIGVDRSGWQHPRCSPAQYLARLSALDAHTLLVHCNHLSEGDIELIARSGARVCVCPATHRFFSHPPHPLPRLLEAGVPVCLGTDSLASSPSLSMWDQARIVAETHPRLAWQTLLAMITSSGAQALRLGEGHGTLRPGAVADLVLATPEEPLASVERQPRRLFDGAIRIDTVMIAGQRVGPAEA